MKFCEKTVACQICGTKQKCAAIHFGKCSGKTMCTPCVGNFIERRKALKLKKGETVYQYDSQIKREMIAELNRE